MIKHFIPFSMIKKEENDEVNFIMSKIKKNLP